MKKVAIYVHGKGGNSSEALHYVPLFPGYDVIGFEYVSSTPWEAKGEFLTYFDSLRKEYDHIVLVANSIGAFFCMSAGIDKYINESFFISPVVDMEKLIFSMMDACRITEKELREKGNIKTPFGQDLSYEYLCYVRDNPIKWNCKTNILYGEKDNLVDYETIKGFANNIGASLLVMQGGEHWFHTDSQMDFLDGWIESYHIKQ